MISFAVSVVPGISLFAERKTVREGDDGSIFRVRGQLCKARPRKLYSKETRKEKDKAEKEAKHGEENHGRET